VTSSRGRPIAPLLRRLQSNIPILESRLRWPMLAYWALSVSRGHNLGHKRACIFLPGLKSGSALRFGSCVSKISSNVKITLVLHDIEIGWPLAQPPSRYFFNSILNRIGPKWTMAAT
jgi:hypothetical protein